METVTLEKSEIKTDKICSAYDDDCCDVPNPLKCFLGDLTCPNNGVTYTFGIADGVCPEMRR